ncbi:MAG: right-handed parallel beta-helix repeat-containing protein [Bacteroidota bacterium]
MKKKITYIPLKNIYIKSVFVFQFILIIANASGQTVLPATLNCNETLALSGSPYTVNNTITIAPGCNLTVEAGVEIKMAENTHLIVKGKVDFLGTASQPILIHAKDTIWGNILLDSTVHLKSTFNYVNIENGRFNVDSTTMRAVIYGYFSSFEVKNCNFKNNLRCIYSYRCSDILIKNCLLDSTNRGEKILTQYADQVTIDNCKLYYTAGDADVIDFDGSSNIIISNNLLYGGGDDGIDLGHAIDPNVPDSTGCTNVTISGNVIFNMFNKAVSNGENAANININHNVMVNCGWGIGAKAGANVVADHNTIYKCHNGVKAYDHFDAWGPGHITVTNSIIVGCDTTWFRDSTASLSVSYSLSDSTLISGTGNIQAADPLFVSASFIPRFDSLLHLINTPSIIASSNFHLQPNSPAVNTGDPAFANDPDGSRSDIGRYYLGQTLGIVSHQHPEEVVVYPNPSNGLFKLSLVPDYSMNQLVIVNSIGQVLHKKQFYGDKTEYSVDINTQSPGVYYLQLISEANTSIKKIIIY